MNKFVYYQFINSELGINGYIQIARVDYVYARKLLDATIYANEIQAIGSDAISKTLLEKMIQHHKPGQILISDGEILDYYPVLRIS